MQKKQGYSPLNIKAFLVVLFIGNILPVELHAAQRDIDDRGEVTNSLLLVNSSVRSIALGGHDSTLFGHAESMFTNPAGLAHLSIPELTLSHTQSFIDTSHNHLGFAFPAQNHAFGISARYMDLGKEERTGISDSGQPVTGLGDFQFSSILTQLSYARKWGQKFSLGASAKGWSDKQDDTNDSGWAFDGGILARNIFPHFDLGLNAKNMGPGNDGFSLPSVYSVGGTLHISNLSVFSQVDFSSFRENVVRVGSELHQKMFWLRGGYENLTSDVNESLGNFSFGGGLNIKGWKVDYAWSPKGDLGDEHRVALTIGFGLTPEDRAKAARNLDMAMDKRLRNRAKDHFVKGMHAKVVGDYKTAVKEFENATTWDPEYYEALTELEVAQQKLQIKDANDNYNHAVKLMAKKQWLDAATHLKKTLTLIPTHENAMKKLAISQKMIKRAKHSASSTDKKFHTGVAYYLDGKYDKALAQWALAAKRNPNNPYIREYIAKAEKMKALNELAAMKKEKEKTTQSIESMSKKAYTLYSLNQVDKAIDLWKDIIEKDPNNMDAKDALAKAQERQKLIDRNSSDSEHRKIFVLNAKAMNAYSEGQLRQAVQIWKQALVLDPHNKRLKNNLNRVKSEMIEKGQQ